MLTAAPDFELNKCRHYWGFPPIILAWSPPSSPVNVAGQYYTCFPGSNIKAQRTVLPRAILLIIKGLQYRG